MSGFGLGPHQLFAGCIAELADDILNDVGEVPMPRQRSKFSMQSNLLHVASMLRRAARCKIEAIETTWFSFAICAT